MIGVSFSGWCRQASLSIPIGRIGCNANNLEQSGMPSKPSRVASARTLGARFPHDLELDVEPAQSLLHPWWGIAALVRVSTGTGTPTGEAARRDPGRADLQIRTQVRRLSRWSGWTEVNTTPRSAGNANIRSPVQGCFQVHGPRSKEPAATHP